MRVEGLGGQGEAEEGGFSEGGSGKDGEGEGIQDRSGFRHATWLCFGLNLDGKGIGKEFVFGRKMGGRRIAVNSIQGER